MRQGGGKKEERGYEMKDDMKDKKGREEVRRRRGDMR